MTYISTLFIYDVDLLFGVNAKLETRICQDQDVECFRHISWTFCRCPDFAGYFGIV